MKQEKKDKLHKIALDRLEYLMDKELNAVIYEDEANEINYLTMYIEMFEDTYYPIEPNNS